MAKFLHVAIGFEGKAVGAGEIQKVFKNAAWARYAPNCWIVHTNEHPETLVDRIRNVCGENDSVLVCEMNMASYNGYLHNEIWEWIGTNLKAGG